MPAGEVLSPARRSEIDRAIRDAETVSRCEFSVFVGSVEGDSRAYARRLHAALTAPERSVLVLVDPAARLLEIVTGSVVRRDLDDSAVQLGAVTMQSAFAEGDLVGGIRRGLMLLAERARAPQTHHAD